MKKLQNTNKGITLIALVITIIVMLILVAVTISMAVNGGLFEYASNAGAQTNAAIANEQKFANLEANMPVDELIDKYTQNSNGCEKCINGYVTGYVCEEYGYYCNVVSSDCEVVGYSYKCSSCGFHEGVLSNVLENMICPTCGIELNPISIEYSLTDCDHVGYGIPQKSTYPCPNCSKDNTLEEERDEVDNDTSGKPL